MSGGARAEGCAPPERPAEPVARAKVLRERILATRRLRVDVLASRPWWLGVALLYLPIGLVLVAARLTVMLSFVLLGVTLLGRRAARALGRRWVLPLLGFRVRASGGEQLRALREGSEPYVIALNHVSYIDPLAVSASLQELGVPAFTFLASVAMGGAWPLALLGRLGFARDFITTTGSAATPAQRATTRAALIRLAEPRPGDEPRGPLVLFPEGQVHDCERYLLRYERFCFGLGLPVAPVAVRHLHPWPVNFWFLGDHPLLSTLWLLFVPWTTWESTALPVMAAAPGEGAENFAARVQAETASALGCQSTAFTMVDVGELLGFSPAPR